MSYVVRWADSAMDGLERVHSFLAELDVEVALHVRAQLSAPGRRLAERLCEVCEALLSPAAGEA